MARARTSTGRSTARAGKAATSTARGDLARYREKRDFGKTPEPSGKTGTHGGGALRFVIQKHAARRLHYDLRLELDGVFKSWAVTRGPSLDPHQKRLAVHVEDHPIEYGDFEGVIPEGEYGAGTVMIWDRGVWQPDGDPAKGYEKGHLAFELDGEKLKGRWHLIRTKLKAREKQEQWLLFKSDDAFAKPEEAGDILEEEPDSVATRRNMDEIAAGRMAVWSTDDDPITIKGAKEAPFPGFIDPSLALLVEKPPEGSKWLHEIKFDGYRLIALINRGAARLMTRRGLDWTSRFPSIAQAFAELPVKSAIADGEAVVEDEHGVSSFSALQEALADHRPANNAIFYAFDLLYLDGQDARPAALLDRKEALRRVLEPNKNAALRYSEHIASEGKAMFEHACRLGLEGIVSKKRDAPYRSGRHGEWVKIKCVNREEFVVGGYAPSTATRNAIGSLALGYYDNGSFIYVGRAGTGFTQKSAQAIYRQLQDLRTPKSPFFNTLTANERRGLVFVEPKLVAEVEFRDWTHDHRLRQAAFKGLREDKPASEVRLEKPARADESKSVEAGMPGMAKKTSLPVLKSWRGDEIEFEGVRLTHPDRVLWEGQGVSKLGLAEYYAAAADYILPHIVNRPLALVRCPNGEEGDCFFQKHSFAGLSSDVEVLPAPNRDEEVLAIKDLRGLISLVQVSVLEIHPWGSRTSDMDHPDRLIFDLDPGEGAGWDALVEGAREVRQRLRDAGVEGYVKTTGGKGLHVVSPLEPSLSWDELKEFARRIALSMEADSPGQYLSAMTKKARKGKIFVDYLRNARGATAVAAYSTRARMNAPIATPIRWDELGPGMTPSRFNVSNIGRRLAALKEDPWEGFFSHPQRIDKAALHVTRGRRSRSSATL